MDVQLLVLYQSYFEIISKHSVASFSIVSNSRRQQRHPVASCRSFFSPRFSVMYFIFYLFTRYLMWLTLFKHYFHFPFYFICEDCSHSPCVFHCSNLHNVAVFRNAPIVLLENFLCLDMMEGVLKDVFSALTERIVAIKFEGWPQKQHIYILICHRDLHYH